jgi:hypothetical protein
MKNPVNPNTPFGKLYNQGLTTSVNGYPANTAMVKLVSARSAIGLFTKGIIPYRGFRLKDFKEFFGVKGNKVAVYNQLDDMIQAIREYEMTQIDEA